MTVVDYSDCRVQRYGDERERRGYRRPTRARPEQKIDAAVALIMAIGRSMTEPERFTSIYQRAELYWRDAALEGFETSAAVKSGRFRIEHSPPIR